MAKGKSKDTKIKPLEDQPVKPCKPSKAEQLALAVEAVTHDMITPPLELFHDPAKDTWAKVYVNDHYENWLVSSKSFRMLLERRMREEMGCMPKKSEVKDALRQIEGTALYDSPEQDVYLRTALHKIDSKPDRIFIDLCNAPWSTVEITPKGWTLQSSGTSPVKFRRFEGMHALPEPWEGGVNELQKLWDFVNVQDRNHQILVLAWLVAALRPSGPYPILCMTGSQGSAKTTSQTFLRNLVDPNITGVRQAPRDERDLSISAMHSHIQGFDNFSCISNWLSDALCRLATGTGFATRKLYTDDDQIFFQGCRPIMLNGISQLAERADLCDRMIIIPLPKITARKAHGQMLSQFVKDRYRIFGGLLSACSTALKNFPKVRKEEREKDELPRMADFACWAIAAAPALGFTREEFLAAYEANRQELRFVSLEHATAVQGVIDWFNSDNRYHSPKNRNEWTGTCKDLLDAVGTGQYGLHGMTPRLLAAELKRAEPNLETVGLKWEELKRQAGTGRRIHKLARIVPVEVKITPTNGECENWLKHYMMKPRLAADVVAQSKFTQTATIEAAKALGIFVAPETGQSWQQACWSAVTV
jgi:hypothetical protein